MLRSLQSQRVRRLRNLFLNSRPDCTEYGIFGRETVQNALNAGVVSEILYTAQSGACLCGGTLVTSEVLSFITGDREREVAAVCRIRENAFVKEDPKRVLLLDHVRLQTNVGKILKIAYLLGVDVIIIDPEDEIRLFSHTVAECSGGALFYYPVKKRNLKEALCSYRREGFFCVGTSLGQSVPLSGISAKEKMLFVMGNERNGVSEELLSECDVRCRIEMDHYDSLNVAVATAILLHRFCGTGEL